MNKQLKKSYIVVLFVISILYLTIRLVGISHKMTYSLDQSFHLIETYQMVQDKEISLIGPMSSKIHDGRGFFIGGQYYYVLAILGIIFNWNPLFITISLIFFELFFLIIYINWLRKRTNVVTSLVLFLFLATNNFLIVHSRFFWNPHFLLPLSIVATITIDKYILSRNKAYLALSAFIWGLAFSFHYSAIFWCLPAFIYLVKNKAINIKTIAYIFLFLILGNLPIVIFETRHNLYNIKTILFIFKYSLNDSSFQPHYFVYPLLIFCITYLSLKIKKSTKLFIVLACLNIFTLIIFSPSLPYGHPVNWDYRDIKKTTNLIVEKGCPNNFNIASTVSGDTRANDIRFLLTRLNCLPLDVDKYPQTNTLFLVAPKGRPPQTDTVWEISSIKPFIQTDLININSHINLYRLDRI